MNKQGFTLIELIVIIMIISTLASVVISTMNKAKEQSIIDHKYYN